MAAFFWDPDPTAFTIPFLNLDVRWYGIFFASGFALAYLVLLHIFKKSLPHPEKSQQLLDKLLLYAVVATVIGARLGHVLFYDLGYYIDHPLQILNIRQGGLASHGAAVGILTALFFFYRQNKREFPGNSFWGFMDLFLIPVPLAGAFIRLGNFVNQEIVGTPTSLPWGVLFAHPLDAVEAIPRHPVQLYEAAAYFALFLLLYFIWRQKTKKIGLISGLFFILLFSSRLLLEAFKTSQGAVEWLPYLDMGQLLSIPFILLGFFILTKYK